MISVSAYTMYCDGCQWSYIYPTEVRNPTAWDALEKSKAAGWTRFGEKDYCPGCINAPKPSHPIDMARESIYNPVWDNSATRWFRSLWSK